MGRAGRVTRTTVCPMSSPADVTTAAPTAPAPRRRRLAAVLGLALFAYVALLCSCYVGNTTPSPLLSVPDLATYLPYAVLLAALVGRYGPLSPRTLYLAGAVLGLAGEAFVTHAVWARAGDSRPVLPAIGGFAPWESVTLVGTYHPVLSALVPVLAGAAVFGTPYAARLPRARLRAVLVALAVLTGVFAGFGHQQPTIFTAALVVNAATFTALVAAHRRWGGPVGPVPRPVVALAALVAVAWSVVGVVRYRPDPVTLAGTLGVLAVLLVALARAVRLDRRPAASPAAPDFRWRPYLAYAGGFAVIATAAYVVLLVTGGLGATTAALVALVAGAAGTGYLALTVLRVLLPRRR